MNELVLKFWTFGQDRVTLEADRSASQAARCGRSFSTDQSDSEGQSSTKALSWQAKADAQEAEARLAVKTQAPCLKGLQNAFKVRHYKNTSSKVEEVLQILRAEELEDARQRLELDVQQGKQA